MPFFLKNKNKAFTLIELLVVVAIVGVLASVVFASLGNMRNKAKFSKAFSTINQLSKAAVECLIEGNTLTLPTTNGVGGIPICPGSNTILPNITDTKFSYCGVSCGGWTSNSSGGYAISVYSDLYSDGRKAIVCGSDVNVSGWYYTGSVYNFIGSNYCKTYGF